MSVDTMTDEPRTHFSPTAIRLLREYTNKLLELTEEAARIPDEIATSRQITEKLGRVAARRDRIVDQFNHVSPPAMELARLVSGQIEDGVLEPIERVELRLRLAEFETRLREAERAIKELRIVRVS